MTFPRSINTVRQLRTAVEAARTDHQHARTFTGPARQLILDEMFRRSGHLQGVAVQQAYVIALNRLVRRYPVEAHRLSDDGLTVVCQSDGSADCRRRPGPECEHETWPCQHEILENQDCWKTEWVNACMLDETYAGPASAVTSYPGKAVVLTWEDGEIGVVWDYA